LQLPQEQLLLQCGHCDRNQVLSGSRSAKALPMTQMVPTCGWEALMKRVAAHMAAHNAHAARTVVLLPFFQLQAVARTHATAFWSSGFLPRLDTTKSWQQRVAPFLPDALDLSFDAALDALRARRLLAKSGLQAKQAVLGALLVETAQQLGGLAAAVPPAERAAWAARMRPVVMMSSSAGAEFAAYEAAVAQIALEWAAASSYASDALFDVALRDVDVLVVVSGVQRNALTQSLASQLGERCLFVDLPQSTRGALTLHAALDAEDEAQRAAACVIAHVAQGRVPVALPAIDRLVTRRISAMLFQAGIALRDETGWKLSTTRAAANLMSLLRAAHPLSSQDERLDWLKHTCASPSAVQQLERLLRKQNAASDAINVAQRAVEFAMGDEIILPDDVLKSLASTRPLAAWLDALVQALRSSGQWADLQRDTAGLQVLDALHLQASAQQNILLAHDLRMSLHEFGQWVQTALEGASFKPPSSPEEAQVVILPLAQLAARPFAALVMAGCDEVHLPLAPEPQGNWNAAQREALGLPSRSVLREEQQTVWQRAMQVSCIDVLWRSFEGEAHLQRSPLLQAWQLAHVGQYAAGVDARLDQAIQPQPVVQPAPGASALASVMNAGQGLRFSASSYQDVRTCPYRFFALRLLGLQEAQELDAELSKRDFGSWLHAVLSEFHQSRSCENDALGDAENLDACAARIAGEWFGQDAGFIPFAASWPQIRSSYLLWLSKHESEGWRFESSELDAQSDVQGVAIQGRLDRVDLLAGSRADSHAASGSFTHMLIDYKTEGLASLQRRVKEPLEDTQLVFYAALLGKENAKAAYLGVSEKETKAAEQTQVNEALPMLLAGLHDDAQRISQGHGLPALGEGMACEYCAARGLCRKDFWMEKIDAAGQRA
jgi:ATP-dependent helicase/nuclease subunit B